MIEHYGVERLDEVTAKQLKEVGFTSELMEFIASQGATKDEVSDFCDRAADENLKLDAILGGIAQSKAKAETAQESSLSSAEPAAE